MRSIRFIDTLDITNPITPLFFIFIFLWLIKVRIIVVLHPVSYCCYAQLCFLFCLCLPLNPTLLPTSELRRLSQRVMAYCCVYHAQLFLPGFILLIEPSYCVPGAINCNKEDLTIISSVTQYDGHQSSDVLLYIWEFDKVGIRGAKGNKERWYCGLCVNEYNIWNSTKSLIHLDISGSHSISWCIGEILPKYQCYFKALK